MATGPETAALVALLKASRRDAPYADLVEEAGSARLILEQEQGLLSATLIEAAAREIEGWQREGIQLLSMFDPEYPENLRGVHDRPPLIFLLGNVVPADSRSVAVIGTREPSAAGLSSARKIAGELVQGRYTVISGLARGIDTAVQRAALGAGGRTLAVIGTGVQRSYPPENAALQRQIASRGAVVSQFRPDTPPARENFPRRNAVMSGLALATVIVEAGPRSGARIQARLALGHGRPVLLMRELLELDWAAALSGRAGVHVVSEPQEIPPLVDELSATDIVAI